MTGKGRQIHQENNMLHSTGSSRKKDQSLSAWYVIVNFEMFLKK